jgi:beta-lactamase regulating signal transducer with metallopeptidase domain
VTLWRHWMVGQLDASLVAGVLLAIALIARHRLSPRVRSALLLMALARLVMPPWIRSPWSEALVDLAPLDDGRSLVALAMQSDVAMFAAAITSAVSMFLLARIAWGCVTAERRWLAVTESLSIRLQPATTVQVRLSRSGEGPFAVGIRRKLIILPESILRLDPAAIDAVIAHEMAHHERGDLQWILAADVLKAIAWFNPLAHLVARALVAAREDGSDDWAVRKTSNDPFTYAQALLQSARIVATLQPFGTAGAHPMGKRLRRLLDADAAREGRLGVAEIALIVIAATAVLPGAHMPSLSTDERIVIVITR